MEILNSAKFLSTGTNIAVPYGELNIIRITFVHKEKSLKSLEDFP